MIRPLREWHRRMASLLLLILPLGYLVLLSRREAPLSEAAHRAANLGTRVPVGPAFILLAKPGIEARLLAATGESKTTSLLVTPDGDPGIPDLLAYWSPTAGDTAELPPDAMLLGALPGSEAVVLPLPAQAAAQSGYLLLYSLAHREIITRVPLAGAT